LAEERGQKNVEEENEEAMYSGVKRTVQNPKTFSCLNKNLSDKSVFTKIEKSINERMQQGRVRNGIMTHQFKEI
jgi:hypothetical protein